MAKKGRLILTLLATSVLIIAVALIIKGNNNDKLSDQEIDLSCEGCNVLFINIELLRADHVGLINHEDDSPTPNIDKFFNNSIIFENAISPSGLTYTSNLAVLTSTEAMLNKHDASNPSQDGKLLVDLFPIIPEVLNRYGYYTIGIGVGDHITEKGDVRLSTRFNKSIYYDSSFKRFYYELTQAPKQPFFMHYHPFYLHYPYEIPIERIKEVPPLAKIDKDRNIVYWDMPIPLTSTETTILSGPFELNETNNIIYKAKVNNEEVGVTYDYIRYVRSIYRTEVRYVDSELEDIFGIIGRNYINNTIIVLYSNHGDGLFDNGIPSHGVSYQSNVHVPLLIKHPKINKQIRINKAISLIDLAPTIYEMTGVKLAHHISGISLVPLIKGRNYDKEYIFGKDFEMEFIIYKEMKLMYTGKEYELFNIQDDTGELNNIYSQNKELATRLKAALTNKKLEQIEFSREMSMYFNMTSNKDKELLK